MSQLNLQTASVRQLFEAVYGQITTELEHTYFWDGGDAGAYQPATKNKRLATQVMAAGGMARFRSPDNRRGIFVHAGFDEVFVLLQQLEGVEREGGNVIKVFRPTHYSTFMIVPSGTLQLLHARWLLTCAHTLRKLREDCLTRRNDEWEMPEIIMEVENYVLHRLPQELPQQLSV